LLVAYCIIVLASTELPWQRHREAAAHPAAKTMMHLSEEQYELYEMATANIFMSIKNAQSKTLSNDRCSCEMDYHHCFSTAKISIRFESCKRNANNFCVTQVFYKKSPASQREAGDG
jgi:hypothetical protein